MFSQFIIIFKSTPKDLEDVSKYPNLFNALIETNSTRWTQENLEKLAGRNLIRVFKRVEEVVVFAEVLLVGFRLNGGVFFFCR